LKIIKLQKKKKEGIKKFKKKIEKKEEGWLNEPLGRSRGGGHPHGPKKIK
jgi:hypothetical protein